MRVFIGRNGALGSNTTVLPSSHLEFLAAHPVLAACAVFADAVDQDAVVADRVEARLPFALAPALLGAQVEVVVGLQGSQAAEDLARDAQHRLAVDELGAEDTERVAVEPEHGVFLGGGATDVARDLVRTVWHAQPLLPLRQLSVEQGREGWFLRGAGRGG
jgi:hypothetical protein